MLSWKKLAWLILAHASIAGPESTPVKTFDKVEARKQVEGIDAVASAEGTAEANADAAANADDAATADKIDA